MSSGNPSNPRTNTVYMNTITQDISINPLGGELQKVAYPATGKTDQPKPFRTSNLVGPVTKNNKPQYAVKWVGYRGPTTELGRDLMEDVPKMINLYIVLKIKKEFHFEKTTKEKGI